MGAHLIDGELQSDKYPTTPRGKVPLSVKDKTAQDLLWEYARRRRVVDAEFSDDLEMALRAHGYTPISEPLSAINAKHQKISDQCRAVAHMAQTIADVHADLAKLHARHGEDAHMDFVGSLVAARMEILGDMANYMDIVEPDDDWLTPIFEGAHADEALRAPIDGMQPQAATLESERDPRNGNAPRPFSIPPLPVGE